MRLAGEIICLRSVKPPMSEYNERNWKTVYSTGNGDGGIDDLTGLSGIGRYVRLMMSQGGPKAGYSLWEFEVYSTKKVL